MVTMRGQGTQCRAAEVAGLREWEVEGRLKDQEYKAMVLGLL